MNIYEMISSIISGIAVLIALLSFRAKKSDKEIDLAKDVAIIKQNYDADKLAERVGRLEKDVAVLDERGDNQIKLLDKLDANLDEIKEHLK